jgi:hypothetical protein
MPQCPEISIDEMLTDSIVRALMAADSVDPKELKALLRSIARHLRSRASEFGNQPTTKLVARQ